ncbi:MAG: hypothetical protein L0227_03100 [Chloroflexi bacterium]|nr:hypothetical protein [Chloroflexota bacterium]MCI0581875.1 hypothetical protein [Chloroflexota bacterium]
MAGRPYRSGEGGFETAELGALTLADDGPLFALLLTHPDALAEDVVFFADGRVVPESDPAVRTLLGWHRHGGVVVLVFTTAAAESDLLVEGLRLAEIVADWDVGRWNEVVLEYWGSADEALVERVADRWDLSREEGWTLASWTGAMWDEAPEPGRPIVGVLAGEVPETVRGAIDWLSVGNREIAAFEARRIVSGETPTYWTTPVAGAWARPAPMTGEAGSDRRRETFVRRTGSVTGGLLAAVEKRCLDSGSAVAWSGEDWVRFDGASRSLRVFPGAAWVDLQLVGADEGALIGMRYRYALPTRLRPPDDAPPEVHVRLAAPADFGPEVQLLISDWLSGRLSKEAQPVARPRIVSREVDVTPTTSVREAGRSDRSG